VTTSLLWTQDLARGEAFARFGFSVEVLQDRPNQSKWVFDFADATLDVGGSYALSDKAAFTGSVGAMVRRDGFRELRASARVVMKF